MKHLFLPLTLLSVMITLPFTASAAMDDEAAYSSVQSMLSSGSSAAEIIAALKEDGRTLAESTVFAMVSGGEDARVAFAKAGVGLAGSQMEAQSVVDAVLATAGETGVVAETLYVAMSDYIKMMPPPPVYTGGNIATGGGAISPST